MEQKRFDRRSLSPALPKPWLFLVIIMACPRRSGSGDGTKRSDQEKGAIRGRGRGSTI